jgi:tetratricopeptide (TPR) repeat protein
MDSTFSKFSYRKHTENNKKNRKWSPIKETLKNTILGIGRPRVHILDWLIFHWNLAVGPQLGAISKVEKFKSKRLDIAVSNEEWINAIRPLEKRIIRQINQSAGETLIESLRFKVKPNLTNPVEKIMKETIKQNTFEKKRELSNMKTKEEGDLNPIEKLEQLKNKFRFVSMAFSFGALTFLANCASVPETAPEKIDLGSSYSTKEINQIRANNPDKNYKDPRSYYHFLMAVRAEREWDFEEAAKNYEKVVNHDPANHEFRLTLARLYLRLGKLDDVEKVCKEALKRFPNDEVFSIILADTLSSRGRNEEALSFLKNGLENSSKKNKTYALAGAIFSKNGDLEKAREMFEKLSLISPGNPLGYHYLGTTLAKLNRFNEAEKSLRKALGLRPSFKKSREFLAWVLEKKGLREKAIAQYNFLLKLDPDDKSAEKRLERLILAEEKNEKLIYEGFEIPEDSTVNLKLGIMFYEQGRSGRALEEFRLLLAEKENKNLRLLIAKIYEDKERYKEALIELDLVRKIEPDSVGVLLQIARMQNLNENIKESIKVLEEAVKIEPEEDQLYHSLSLAYMSENNYQVAIKNIRKAIEIDNRKDSYFFELGALLERMGNYEEAIKSMQQVLEINPMHSNAHNFIGYMYALQGKKLDLAIDHLKKALMIQPQNGYFLDSLGWVYFKKGENKKALTEIKKAMIYTDPDPVLYEHLGDIHYSLKNYFEANKAWKISLSLTNKKVEKPDGGELPDSSELKRKIQDVRVLLNNSL